MADGKKYLPYLFCLLVLLLLFVFYTSYSKKSKTLEPELAIKVLSFQDPPFSLKELNKIAALGSIGLIAIAFIIGPLSRLLRNIFGKFLYFRKPVGLIGFSLRLLHGIYSVIVFYNLDINKMFIENDEWIATVSAIAGFFVFFLMAITSNKLSVEKLGYKKWKTLQTFGYVGLGLVVIHFFIIETKPDTGFDVRPFGLLFFYIPIIAIILRMVLLLIKTKEKDKFEHHFENSGNHNNGK